MAGQNYIRITLHKQVDPVYCGAACEEMIIQAMTKLDLSQYDLFTESQSQKRDQAWNIDPDGMAAVLSDHTSGFGKRFVPAADSNNDVISHQICWAIYGNGVASAAAIKQGNHWVVVNGFVSNRQPTGPDDHGFTISHIHTIDPFSSEAAPGLLDIPLPYTTDKGWASYAHWLSYFVPVSRGQYWKGQCVAVCPVAQQPSPA